MPPEDVHGKDVTHRTHAFPQLQRLLTALLFSPGIRILARNTHFRNENNWLLERFWYCNRIPGYANPLAPAIVLESPPATAPIDLPLNHSPLKTKALSLCIGVVTLRQCGGEGEGWGRVEWRGVTPWGRDNIHGNKKTWGCLLVQGSVTKSVGWAFQIWSWFHNGL